MAVCALVDDETTETLLAVKEVFEDIRATRGSDFINAPLASAKASVS